MYEYIDESIDDFKKKTQSTFNNSRLSLLKFDELNVLQVKRESDKLFNKLRRQAETFLANLILFLARRDGFDSKEYELNHFLAMFNAVLLYSFDTESDRKRARHFESIIAIGDMNSHRILKEQKKEIRYWVTMVEEIAVDIEREIVLNEAKKNGVKKIQWVTMNDERVCIDCADLNGRVFDIGNVPHRPHIGCRCQLKEIRS